MKQPNPEYYYESEEVLTLINHPYFQPVDPKAKWLPLTSSFFSQEIKDQITGLKDDQKLLIPFNDMNHINGVVLEKQDGQLQITWLDSYESYYLSERQSVFLQSLREMGVSFNSQITNKRVAQQGMEPASCGPRTIDNLRQIGQDNEPTLSQDQTFLRARDMHCIDSENFNSYQSFPSDAMLRADSEYPSPEKEAAKQAFILEVVEKMEGLARQKTESSKSKFSSPSATREVVGSISSAEIVTQAPKPAESTNLKLRDPENINIEKLDKMSLEVPVMMMFLKLHNEASAELKKLLSDWSKVVKDDPSKKESSWSDMIGKLSGKDKDLIKELESEGYNHNPEAIAKINKNLVLSSQDPRNIRKIKLMIELAVNFQHKQFEQIVLPQTPVISLKKEVRSL